MYFFRDELEKQAFFTPPSALKAMNYAKPGFLGNFIRGAGHAGARAQEVAAGLTRGTSNVLGSSVYGLPVALGTAKGELANAVMKRLRVPKPGRQAFTAEGRTSLIPETFNPIDIGNLI